MKFVVLMLLCIGFVAIIDAKAFARLANDGQIIVRQSCDCQYIPGILPLIWNPIFEVLKLRLGGCAVGYIELIESTMYDTDRALIMKNSSYVLVSFKVYANLYQVLLPFIRDRRMYQVIVESLEAGKPLLESLTNGEIDLCAINEVVRKGSNDLNDCL